MSGTRPHEKRLISQSYEVYFAGWKSTTAKLQQEGWRLSAEQSPMSNSVRLALWFEPCNTYALTEPVPYGFFHDDGRYSMGGRVPPVFRVTRFASDFTAQVCDGFRDFEAIDARPQMHEIRNESIKDFNMFAAPLVRTEEIIVEPETVADLMSKIRRLQGPELAAIRERNRLAAARGDYTQDRQKFHAQILSIAA
jgi:hypothetical protein